ncbi:MAG: alanyl-tRNA editing protein [Anaerolineae bacterium]|nr:alanyl-tRNA editing protein [Candidatus Roseilinea sp.]MDW8448784.1 alanyl-tRNA editing protein [Anaerolineae bacterium]
MALRLYRTDAYLTSFTARVAACVTHKGTPALVLDQTAFYPEAGGQPHDTGTIAHARVMNVVEDANGEILHVLESGASDGLQPGDEVQCSIDWARRFDHMQQHSGQHVLSQAFIRVAGLDTIAIHIGQSDCTIDLPAPALPTNAIERAEREANAIVMEDRPILAYEVSDADLPAIPLRRPPKVSGAIRIVEVKDYDWSACGGTHVRNTAQIGLIKIIKAEKRGAETRITFRCGGRAFDDYARLSAATGRLMEALSAGRYDVEQAVQKLIAEARADRKALQDAQARLIAYEAAELLAGAAHEGEQLWVTQAFAGRDPSELRALAKQLTGTSRVVVLLGASGDKAQLIFARAQDATGDMAAALRCALAVLSPDGAAKGGGAPAFAQGGGVTADLARVQAAIAAARAWLCDQPRTTSVSADKS